MYATCAFNVKLNKKKLAYLVNFGIGQRESEANHIYNKVNEMKRIVERPCTDVGKEFLKLI